MYHIGGCQNYGPFLGTLNIRCRTILGTEKGTIILTTAHINCPKQARAIDKAQNSAVGLCWGLEVQAILLGLRGLGV